MEGFIKREERGMHKSLAHRLLDELENALLVDAVRQIACPHNGTREHGHQAP